MARGRRIPSPARVSGRHDRRTRGAQKRAPAGPRRAPQPDRRQSGGCRAGVGPTCANASRIPAPIARTSGRTPDGRRHSQRRGGRARRTCTDEARGKSSPARGPVRAASRRPEHQPGTPRRSAVSLEPRRGYQGTNLVDVLDRILDKGLVVAGDVRISLANVELLTIRIRLLVCSIDKAEQIGLNWWRYDRSLVAQEATEATITRLEQRIAELERQLALTPTAPTTATRTTPSRPRKR